MEVLIMMLCLGTYLNILKHCVLPKTENKKLISTLVGTIDPRNHYNKDNDTAVSRIMSGKRGFPFRQIQPKHGSKRQNSGTQTQIMKLAEKITAKTICKKFASVMEILNKHMLADAVNVLCVIIKNDPNLQNNKNNEAQEVQTDIFHLYFSECLECQASDIIDASKTMEPQEFLARIFLYTVRINDKNDGREAEVKEVKDKNFWENSLKKINDEIKKTPKEKVLEEVSEEQDFVPSKESVGVDFLTSNLKITNPKITNDALIFDKHSRYLLDEISNRDYAKKMLPAPERFMILSLYFITLKYNDEYYVVLDYTSYVPENESYEANRGQWVVPYTAVLVKTDRIKPTKINGIHALYSKTLETEEYKIRHKQLQDDLLYDLGILEPEEPEEGQNYIEYKLSHTSKDDMRCFYIREFFVHDIDDNGILNLIDPEGLHHHYLVPISLLCSRKPVNGVYHFMGRTIPLNVIETFIDNKRLKQVISYANTVKASHMLLKLEGILFVITISDAAKIYRSIPDKYIAALVEQTVPFVFEQCMREFNVRYYSISSSQIIGLLPSSNKDFTDLLNLLYAELTDMLTECHLCIFIRCTVLSCECLYGKLLTPCDAQPGFAGKDFE